MSTNEPAAADAGAGRVDAAGDAFRRLVALVVDDSASQRRMLALLLGKWNFEIVEAEDGAAALEVIDRRAIDFVISDWMMPGLSGPELCTAIRRRDLANYVYCILLTSRTEKNAVATGLHAGADDFLVKPVDVGELRARLRAGQRLLMMQEDLIDKNRRITEAFDRLNALYQSIDRDLKAAARLQKSLVPDRQAHCGPVNIGTAYRPQGHVGGDLVGFFRITESRIAAYSIDVSGHGISSALMTARLSNFFAPHHLDENIAIRRLPNGEYHPRDPAAIAAELNARLQDEADNDQYFTMLFADIDLDTGRIRFCQAGHPSAAVVRRDGAVEFVGQGGAPVGLMPGMDYETETVELAPGDRIMMFSDGIVECESPSGEMFEVSRLSAVLRRTRHYGEAVQLDRVIAAMTEFAGSGEFHDDVSALLLTMP